MANNDAVFNRPSAGAKSDARVWRTCRKCGGNYPLEHFPLQPLEVRGVRMQVCTYCRNKGLAGQKGSQIDWYAIPLREEYIRDDPQTSLKDRLMARARARHNGDDGPVLA